MRQFVWSCATVVLILGVARAELSAAEKPKPESAAATFSTTAPDYVRQALLAETRGDNQERTRLLTKAWFSVPSLPEANWHMARVRVNSEWLPLANVVNQTASDPNDSKYRGLRDKSASNPDALRALARWCRKEGWPDRSRLHYVQLLMHPAADSRLREEAVKELDLVPVAGGWMTKQEIQAGEAHRKAIEIALAKWRPGLKKLQLVIDGEDYAARDKAIDELRKLDDPQIIPALESFLADGGDRFCEEVTRQLAKCPHFEATEALLCFTVLSPYTAARDTAIAGLRTRPKHDYMPLLLSGLIAPIKSQYSIAVAKGGAIQYTHMLTHENPAARLIGTRDQVSFPASRGIRTGALRPERSGRVQLDLVKAHVTRAQLAAHNVQVQAGLANLQVDDANRRVFEALEHLADARLPRDANQWWNWWQDFNEYYWPKPSYYVYEYQPTYYVATIRTQSCFLAGTPVRTQTGQVPIESIQPGDRVLAQDQDTGELAYKVVLTTTLRPPAQMLKIRAGGEDVVTTLGHPFWVSGHGWKMAKQLQPGNLLHGLGGAVPIEKVEPSGDERAYNLVVDDFNTYFVGQAGLLVHDNEFRQPTRATVPGLAAEGAPQREIDVAANE